MYGNRKPKAVFECEDLNIIDCVTGLTGTLAIAISNQQDIVTGLNEQEKLFTLYPNPAARLKGVESKRAVKVPGFKDNVIRELNAQQPETKVELNATPGGVYVVQVFDGETYAYRRLLVK